MKTISQFLWDKRLERGLSLRDVSKLTGISHVHIRTIEQGGASPSFEKVIAILNAYRVTAKELKENTGYELAKQPLNEYLLSSDLFQALNKLSSDEIEDVTKAIMGVLNLYIKAKNNKE